MACGVCIGRRWIIIHTGGEEGLYALTIFDVCGMKQMCRWGTRQSPSLLDVRLGHGSQSTDALTQDM